MLNVMTPLSLCIAIILYISPPAFGWDLLINDSKYLPPSMIVVDKGAKKLFHMEKHSPLTVRHDFPSIHGEIDGDKKHEGDLKTPEGVYFITGRISYPIDFSEYGSQAHALNYPNPVDRLKGKTGNGIWIHSKGEPIKNQVTRGCVAIDLNNIATLEPYLAPGTPVVLAQNVIRNVEIPFLKEVQNIDTSSLDAMLVKKTIGWNTAWATKSTKFFDFYEAKSYTKAQGRPFSVFKRQKQQIFNSIPWIYIGHDDIRVLHGPDYAVTWFKQYYRTPNLVTEGIRSLYWQKNTKGEYVIVGMEWRQGDYGLHSGFQKKVQHDVLAIIDAWKNAWEQSDIDAYTSYYSKNARQDYKRGRAVISDRKRIVWKTRKPVKIEFKNIKVNVKNDGIYIKMIQIYEDSSGYKDKGEKLLVLHPHADKWHIVKELWTKTT